MTPTPEILLRTLPPFQDVAITIKDRQKVSDIIREVCAAHKEFAPYYDEIAPFFAGDNLQDTCQHLYDFCKRYIKYHEEPEADQTTGLPSRLLSIGKGDCKHYSGFIGGVLDALNRIEGRKIKWSYRFASYDLLNKTPHHVFVVAFDAAGKEIWIDPTPGADGKTPVWQIDKSCKNSTMALRRYIAGLETASNISFETVPQNYGADTVLVDRLPVYANEELNPVEFAYIEQQEADEEITPELEDAIRTLMAYGVMNASGQVSDSNLQKLSLSLSQTDFAAVANAREVLQVAINRGAAMGNVFDDIWRGVKKVVLALPRNAYLSLVAVNAFGMATKLYNAIYNSDGKTFHQPGQDQLYKKWRKLGGDWKNLRNAINSGHKKPAILGTTNAVGVAAAALPAWVAIASAIIAALTPLVNSIIRARHTEGTLAPNIDPATGLPYGVKPGSYNSGTGSGDIMQWIKDNPLPSILIGGAIVYVATEKKGR
jgi:hypothetical protein